MILQLQNQINSKPINELKPTPRPLFLSSSFLQRKLSSAYQDLHTENFHTVSLPEDIDVSSDRVYNWSFKDRLCVSDLRQGVDSDVWVLVQYEASETWERTRFLTIDVVIPPLKLNSAWFSPSLVSPYQSSSRPTKRQSTSAQCQSLR
ncbi:unnamed protein product [Thlaspi arvense]|uniref:Uncharacterized protein n=1 Tax=Thlaspi arvense TaxID=13288 RepID=A0AAU9R6Y9_THLAR|nr:unnamed protein product [Thlaspi arvense]